MIILGIDPGVARVGFGVLEVDPKKDIKTRSEYIICGVIETDKNEEHCKRLIKIEKEINALIKKYNPDAIAIEKLFFFKNHKTAIDVSQAIGVIKLAIGKKKISMVEITPLQAKMIITGYGQAKKSQIQDAVVRFLNLKEKPRPDDAADALALALSLSWQL